MRNRTNRTLALALALSLGGSALALAAGPLKGKTYEGNAPTTGISSEGHHKVRVYAGGTISLRVSGSGRDVTVRFSSSYPVIYCNSSQKLQVQTTKPARISGSGSFSAAVDERYKAGPGAPGIIENVSGRFNGRSVSGTIQTNAGGCSGVSYFSAKAG
jgi:hypothetical protein